MGYPTGENRYRRQAEELDKALVRQGVDIHRGVCAVMVLPARVSGLRRELTRAGVRGASFKHQCPGGYVEVWVPRPDAVLTREVVSRAGTRKEKRP